MATRIPYQIECLIRVCALIVDTKLAILMNIHRPSRVFLHRGRFIETYNLKQNSGSYITSCIRNNYRHEL